MPEFIDGRRSRLSGKTFEHPMEADSASAKLLRELEERLLRPDVRRSPAVVSDLLADEFVEFGSSGRVFDKQQIIEALRGEQTTSQRSVLEFRTRVLAPGVVLVTYRLARSESGAEAPNYSLRSSIWKLIGGRWQMVFHQGTASQGYSEVSDFMKMTNDK